MHALLLRHVNSTVISMHANSVLVMVMVADGAWITSHFVGQISANLVKLCSKIDYCHFLPTIGSKSCIISEMLICNTTDKCFNCSVFFLFLFMQKWQLTFEPRSTIFNSSSVWMQQNLCSGPTRHPGLSHPCISECVVVTLKYDLWWEIPIFPSRKEWWPQRWCSTLMCPTHSSWIFFFKSKIF